MAKVRQTPVTKVRKRIPQTRKETGSITSDFTKMNHKRVLRTPEWQTKF